MSNIKTRHKLIIIVIMFALLLLSFKLFTLARFKNRVSTSLNIWSGNIATSYKSGTGSKSDPYIISNGEELAYFSSRLEDNNYENTYFKITNDIILNEGKFEYLDGKIKYVLNNNTYYIKDGDYYDNDSFTGEKKGSLNKFLSMNNFKGNLDGDYHTIYGIYNDSTDSSLFSELDGKITSLYIDNSLMIGSNTSSLLVNEMNNAYIENIMVNGIVISNSSDNENTRNINIDSVVLNSNETKEISIPEISNDKITRFVGNITSLPGIKIIINGTEFTSEFNTILNNQNTIVVQNTSDSLVTVDLTNTKYIESDRGLASGIAIEANNSNILNCINKASVYSDYNSSGIVSIVNNTNINNSYNVGNIKSVEYSAAIANNINNSNITIDKVYNVGLLSGRNTGLFNVLKDTSLLLNNSFIVTDDYIVNKLNNSFISGSYNYYVYTDKGIDCSTSTSNENLKSKSFLLNYNEFIDFDDLKINNNNIWIFDEESYPKLFIDDEINDSAKLYVNIYEFDSYSHILDRRFVKDKIVFDIVDKDELNLPKEKYYYISNSSIPISKRDLNSLEWIKYNKPIEISIEGYYVIYVKIVEADNSISYINSDLIILDNSPSEINISMSSYNWNSLNNGSIYVNTPQEISINAIDDLSDIKSLEYIYSDKYLDLEELEECDDWINYTDTLNLNTVGEYYLYVKAVNNIDYVNYASSPKIIYDGYNIDFLTPFGLSEVDNNITSNSKIIMQVNYNNNEQIQGGRHYLVANTLLPSNTKITLIDNISKKVYGLKIDDKVQIIDGLAKYPFSDFNEKGKSIKSNYIDNTVTNENFTVIIDFSDSIIDKDLKNIYVSIDLEKDNNIVRSTLNNDYKHFNIYSDNTLRISHNISSNFSSNILYNSDSSNTIRINNIINYKDYLNETIYDTDYSNKKSGLLITLVDDSNNIMDDKYLKNLVFKVNDITYVAGTDNKIRINLNSNISSVVDLEVITHRSSSILNNGTYYLRISGYCSYDGLYFDEELDNPIMIPVIVDNSKHSSNFDFDVNIPMENRILEKSNATTKLNFDINENNLIDPTILVSLYIKDKNTAYNQDYTLIDLNSYVNEELVTYIDKLYYVPNIDQFTLNLKTNQLEKTGYKLVFDLYVDNKLLSSVNKYFVVR